MPNVVIKNRSNNLVHNPSDLEIEKLGIERKIPQILEYARSKAGRTHAERMAGYNQEKADFEAALKIWPKEYQEQLKATLEASRFVDWAHMAADILETFRSRGRLSILEREVQFLYNDSRSKADPEFQNMRAVNKFLRLNSMQPCLSRLLSVHKIAMAGEVEGLQKRDLGKVRDYPVIGDQSKQAITPTEVKRINANPYVSFEIRKVAHDGAHYGMIVYPEPTSIKSEALERIKYTHVGVYEEVQRFRQANFNKQLRARDQQTGEYSKLTRVLLTALVEERYKYFASESSKFVRMETMEEVLGYIKCVALHYRDLISIHPLGNGNGRSLRYESLYDPLDKVGISRPRLNDPNADILFSPSAWVREVQRGILSTDALYKDMTRRISLGLRIENSPELLFPNLVRDVGVELRFRGRKKVARNVTLQRIDPAQFGAYVDARLSVTSGLQRKFNHDPVSTMNQVRQDYKDFAKNNIILGFIPQKGLEQIGLYLVDFDQRSVFGVPVCKDKPKWDYKVKRWHLPNLIWRGLCHINDELTVQDILEIFTRLTPVSLSNRVAVLPRSDYARRQAVQVEFDRYNKDLLNNKLHFLVDDHVQAKGDYDVSYGLSTSRDWKAAAGFAWGRGTFGYNNEEIKQKQSEIKSRLLVGAYQALKDVDVRRLKLVKPDFSYTYGRQQEVMAVGGIDPDMIMTVQLLDETRKTTTCFIRNKNQPSEIWEMKQGYDFKGHLLNPNDVNFVLRKHQL
jgi:hypothetical protein